MKIRRTRPVVDHHPPSWCLHGIGATRRIVRLPGMLARDFRDQGSARGTWERLARITFLWHSATNPSGPACGRPAHPKVWMIALKATCLKRIMWSRFDPKCQGETPPLFLFQLLH